MNRDGNQGYFTFCAPIEKGEDCNGKVRNAVNEASDNIGVDGSVASCAGDDNLAW